MPEQISPYCFAWAKPHWWPPYHNYAYHHYCIALRLDSEVCGDRNTPTQGFHFACCLRLLHAADCLFLSVFVGLFLPVRAASLMFCQSYAFLLPIALW